MTMEKYTSQTEKNPENPKLDYLRDAYLVGDSLSVGIMGDGDKNKSDSVEGRKETTWMLNQVHKNINTLKTKKVLFLLGGTNDIWNGKNPDTIKKNLQSIAEIARTNGVKVVVATIPPIDNDYNYVKNRAGKSVPTWEVMNERIRNVNEFIKSNFDYIDFHGKLEDPSRPGHFIK